MRKLLRMFALVAGLALLAAVAACSPAENEGAASSVYYTVTFDAQGGSEVRAGAYLRAIPSAVPQIPCARSIPLSVGSTRRKAAKGGISTRTE